MTHIRRGTGWLEWERLPDYLNDLNAMHGARKTLTDEQSKAYWRELFTIVERDKGSRINGVDIVEATASQRADPFLLSTLSPEYPPAKRLP